MTPYMFKLEETGIPKAISNKPSTKGFLFYELITFTNLPLDLTGKAMLRQMERWENEVVLELSMFFLFEWGSMTQTFILSQVSFS
jgi:hypothetical protein